MIDEFDSSYDFHLNCLKEIISSGSHIEVFDVIQFILRQENCPIDPKALGACLANSRAAYGLLEDGKTFFPITSVEETESVNHAFVALSANGYAGARSHLNNAADALTAGKYTDSIRESIHAVESVARIISGGATSLKDALNKLKETRPLHPAFQDALNKLYAYTSDEKGVRHALLESDQAKVDEADAIFMIGACASFVSYLINKSSEVTAK